MQEAELLVDLLAHNLASSNFELLYNLANESDMSPRLSRAIRTITQITRTQLQKNQAQLITLEFYRQKVRAISRGDIMTEQEVRTYLPDIIEADDRNRIILLMRSIGRIIRQKDELEDEYRHVMFENKSILQQKPQFSIDNEERRALLLKIDEHVARQEKQNMQMDDLRLELQILSETLKDYKEQMRGLKLQNETALKINNQLSDQLKNYKELKDSSALIFANEKCQSPQSPKPIAQKLEVSQLNRDEIAFIKQLYTQKQHFPIPYQNKPNN